MCEAVQDVSLVAQALEAARVVDAGVVAGSLKGALVNVWGRPERYKTAEKHGRYDQWKEMRTGNGNIDDCKRHHHQCSKLNLLVFVFIGRFPLHQHKD